MAKQENDLGRDAIGTLVLRIAVPSMLAQFVSVLYSIVDRMYIGNIPMVGDVALAGVGVCGPVVTMVGSVAFLIGVGGAPLMSIKLGEKDEAGARRIMANCFLMLCVSAAALMAGIFPFARRMLLVFGASEATLPYAMPYFTTYLMGTPFALMATGLNQLIVCQGFAKAGMKSILLGAVMNIVLDPVFIFTLGMGVRGGALATVLSQMASCAYAVWFLLFSKRAPISITFGGYSLRVMGRVLALGFSPFIIIAMDNVMIIAMNALLQRYGGAAEGDMLVTCATIAQSFMLVVTMPLGGHHRRHAEHSWLQLRRVQYRAGKAGRAHGDEAVRGLHPCDDAGRLCRRRAVCTAVLARCSRARAGGARHPHLRAVHCAAWRTIRNSGWLHGAGPGADSPSPLVLAQGRVLCGAVRPARRVRRTGHLLRRARF